MLACWPLHIAPCFFFRKYFEMQVLKFNLKVIYKIDYEKSNWIDLNGFVCDYSLTLQVSTMFKIPLARISCYSWLLSWNFLV